MALSSETSCVDWSRGRLLNKVVLAVEEATAPFQHALSTKGGGECVAHAIQSLTELDPRATVLSVDGIGAFDLIACATMLDGPLNVDGGDSVLPFVLQFYSEPSQYLWEDDTGDTHLIEQGEGGEQGDPLMPLLFSLGQHSALQSLQSFLLPGEQLFAYLDNLYVVCSPERVGAIFTRLKSDLESHARIQVHLGKTKVWNRAGEEPEACSSMQEAAQRVDLDARVWTGDGPLSQQGLRVLGIPIGTPEFVRSQLEQTSLKHKVLFNRLTSVEDLQSAWLLLLFCANTRVTYSLRGLPPQETEHFATEHDADSRRRFSLLLGVSLTQDSWEKSSLPMSLGGCGLRSASRTSSSAYWASWADSLRMIHQRHPAVADQMVRSLTQVLGHRHFVAAAACRDQLIACGFSPPTWAEAALARPRAVFEALHVGGPCFPLQGSQHVASACVEDHFFQSVVLPRCLPPERALLRSQCGPLSGLQFVACPSSPHQRFASHLFRVLFLRRLHLPLPLSSRSCRCGRSLDARGHHRTSCPTSWVLGRRGFALESAAARVCREAGARVRTNVFVRDLDLLPQGVPYQQRLEVVAEGLPLFHGAQLAIDTTLVSPLRADGGSSHPMCKRGWCCSATGSQAERAHIF